MKHILSIQSHVAYGYVGNRAAVFPLQRLGFDVSVINTVQFSNHTGYGSWTGEIFSPAHIENIVDGLEARGVLSNIDAVLTGYMGDKDLGDVVLKTIEEIRQRNDKAFYCCDPVMGDNGRGFFVKDELPPFFKSSAVPQANLITPNQFELSALSDISIVDRNDVFKACDKIHASGPDTILVTSLHTEETQNHHLEALLSLSSGEKWIITTPRIPFDIEPNGSGDMTTALFMGHMMNGLSPQDALESTINAVYAVLEITFKAKRRELSIIAAQDHLCQPDIRFKAINIS